MVPNISYYLYEFYEKLIVDIDFNYVKFMILKSVYI